MSEILTNKTYRNYNYTCRYTPIPYYFHKLDNKYIYGTSSQLIKNNTFVYHTIN
jgi:hypothetical protein